MTQEVLSKADKNKSVPISKKATDTDGRFHGGERSVRIELKKADKR